MNILRLFIILPLFLCLPTIAQIGINGIIKDKETSEPLIGASVMVKGTLQGKTTDFDGKFDLIVTDKTLPFVLEFSFIGYDKQEYTVTQADEKIKISLSSTQYNLDAFEVTDTRITEKMKESPQTIETMDAISIKESSSADFYEGLGHLKGVDVTSASIGFKIINTRGFNSTNPVRSLQLIDGVDNQSPGLNFSLGNFLGASELDIQKVELVVGANGAMFGPSAFNGVINMITKDPFLHPGLSIQAKVGERRLMETAIRYAHVFKNKNKEDMLAVKANFHYMQALDWEANNLDSVFGEAYGPNNPGGYNAVNRYGDENPTQGINNATGNSGLVNRPGLGRWYRTGYQEKDIVDYNTKNLKASGALHYKLAKDLRIIASSNFATGTTVMQGDNRYSLKGIKFYQHKLELKKDDRFFLRTYMTHEDAGQSYDAVFTALLLQQGAKDDNSWTKDYNNYWISNIAPIIHNDPSWPVWNPFFQETPYDKINAVIDSYKDSLFVYHQKARAYADAEQALNPEDVDRYQVGTTRFDSAFSAVVSKKSYLQGGSGLYDKSLLYHVHGEYKFTPQKDSLKLFDVVLGGNYRLYRPKSDGTIFNEKPIYDTIYTGNTLQIDTSFEQIKTWEYGAYIGLSKAFLKNDALKINTTLRIDKNKNFDPLFSPAISGVLVKNGHTYRLSFSSAIRNPTLADQYLQYNVGRAILLGNLNGKDNLVTTESLIAYFNTDNLNTDSLVYFDVAPIRPEKVKSVEIGYRGTIWNKWYLDASYYFSFYKDFIGYKIGVETQFDSILTNRLVEAQAYRIASNAESSVTTQGFSIGLIYYFKKYYSFSGNYSWNKLNKKGTNDPIIPAFNTPENKFNLGISGRDLNIRKIKHIGFAINYKWIQGFLYEGSPQFTGLVPSYDGVDAQMNYFIPRVKTTFKIGVSNLFGIQPFFDKDSGDFTHKLKQAINNKNMQVYGGPFVGRMAYFSILVEI